MGVFCNPCFWPLAAHPKYLMSFWKGAFSSYFLIFSLNPEILSGQSILEVFQGNHNLACLTVNYCKVWRSFCSLLLLKVIRKHLLLSLSWRKKLQDWIKWGCCALEKGRYEAVMKVWQREWILSFIRLAPFLFFSFLFFLFSVGGRCGEKSSDLFGEKVSQPIS